ncbi:hypothetical protein ACTFIV_008199 [Dictyostelium citrinum]
MKFLICLLLIVSVLINSALGSFSILALKHQCKSYCANAENYAQDLITEAVGAENIQLIENHAENDFRNSFPEHYEKIVEMKDYLQSCEHACDSLIQEEIFKYFQ